MHSEFYFCSTVMAKTAFTVHHWYLLTAHFYFYQIIPGFVSQPTLLCGCNASSAPGLALPMLDDLKQDYHLLLTFSAQKGSYPTS